MARKRKTKSVDVEIPGGDLLPSASPSPSPVPPQDDIVKLRPSQCRDINAVYEICPGTWLEKRRPGRKEITFKQLGSAHYVSRLINQGVIKPVGK